MDINESMNNFKIAIRDAVEVVTLAVEGALQQAAEAQVRRDLANAEANAAKLTLGSLQDQIAKLSPERDDLEARVAALKKAIAAVSAVSL